MELRQLRYLVSIIDFGSFSRASSQLNIAQPALSRQMTNLEAELETPLLVRSASGVVPTDAGLRLYRQAQAILGQVDQAKMDAKLTQFSEQFAGRVTIGLPASAATILALPLIQRLRERYPGIHIRLIEMLSGHLLEMLLKNRIDLAMQFSDEHVTGLHVEPLLVEDLFVVWCNAESADQPIRFAELANRPMAIPGKPHAMRKLIDRYCLENEIELNVIAEVDSLPALRALAAAGIAHAILPQSALLSQSAMGRPTSPGPLYTRPIVSPTMNRPLSLCRSEGAPRSRAVAAVEEVLRFLVKDLVTTAAWRGVRLHAGLATAAPDKGLMPKPPRRTSAALAGPNRHG